MAIESRNVAVDVRRRILQRARFLRLLTSAATFVGLLSGVLASHAAPKPYTTWQDYGGGIESMQYSALSQINNSNVGKLTLAWHYPVPDRRGNFGFNPLVVDGVMYVLGRSNSIVALDATNGKQIWSYHVDNGAPGNRGINYWESPDRADRRLIYAANGLRELNARTGEPITTFGEEGRVNMRTNSPGSPRILGGPSSSPGRVFENLFITGSSTGEGYFSSPGDIRAYDIITGKLVWTFRTIPIPGDYGYETWSSNAWRYAGGVNCWGEISVDPKRGIAYVPLGSPTHDMFGGDRRGANLFGNCLVALDARTGKRLWHFQAIHHDLWDYDLVSGPKLLTVRHDGKPVDVVAQATKFGVLYVFNRVTGEPLWPIEEIPVPKSDVPGEVSSPTQPFPTKPRPYARLQFPVWDINPYLEPGERARIRTRLAAARNEGVFTPPTLDREQVSMPGEFGGSNWAGTAGDPETGVLYVRTADYPTIHTLRPSSSGLAGLSAGGEAVTDASGQHGRSVYAQICMGCHGEPVPNGIMTLDRSAVIPVRELGNERIAMVIRQGQNQMPAFPEDVMNEQMLQSLLAYLTNPSAATNNSAASSNRLVQNLMNMSVTNSSSDRGRNWRGGGSAGTALATAAGLEAYSDPRYDGPLGHAFRSTNSGPVISPPWSEVVAYDLNEGTIKWRSPFGSVPALAARGIKNTGNGRRAWRCGMAVTGGGLVFIGCWADRTAYAFDKENGRLLWQYELQANPEGMASIFEAGGRQYVAFCASGSNEEDVPAEQAHEARLGLTSAQGYYVFALPEK
jgi:quinoprotein glucose dehydrogenase